MKRVAFALAFVLVVARGVPASDARDLAGNWFSDGPGFQEGMQQCQANGKPLLLYFYTDWCGYCRRLETNVLNSPEVGRYVDEVLAVRINPEHGSAERALAKEYGVNGYPTLFMVTAQSGKRQEVSASFKMSPAEFIAACRQAGGEETSARASPRPKRTSKSPQSRKTSAKPPTGTKPAGARQDPALGPVVTLHLKNGSTISGALVRETPHEVTIRWEFGQITFRRAEIERLSPGSPERPTDF